MIQLAQWDTDNLGLKIGNLHIDGDLQIHKLKKEIAHSVKEGYDLLYLKGVTLPEDCLSSKLLLADEKVVYAQDIDNNIHTVDPHVVSFLNHELTPALWNLTLESGWCSRYKTDSNFPPEVFSILYRQWILKSLNGTIATDVLVYNLDNIPVGLLTYKKNEEIVDIGLVAVSKDYAGKGIGTKLMKSFLSMFEKGTRVEVATQRNNKMACHFYERNGFVVNSISNIYHIWNK